MSNIHSLRELVKAVDNDIVVHRTVAVKQYKVTIYNDNVKDKWNWSKRVSKLLSIGAGKGVINKRDPRLITAAINRLSAKALRWIEVTKEQLLAVEYVPQPTEPGYAAEYIGDSRILYMDPVELKVQQALGIKDPNPIRIRVSKTK